MKRNWLVLLGATVFLAIIAGCSNGGDSTTEDGKKIIKVALSDDVNPPFLYTDDENNPIGYDMDYLAEVEKRLTDYKFEYIFGEEESNLVGLDTGKVDMAINWFFKNPEREEKFHYPKTEYGYSLTSLITKPDRDDIKTLDDMVGKKFTPMSAGGGLRSILNGYNTNNPDNPLTIESMEHPSNADNLKRVDEGKADAIFLNKSTFDAVQETLNLDLKVAGIVSKEPIFVVYNKENIDLADQIDEITVELTEDGTLSKLSEKWFSTDFFQDLDYINEQGFSYKK